MGVLCSIIASIIVNFFVLKARRCLATYGPEMVLCLFGDFCPFPYGYWQVPDQHLGLSLQESQGHPPCFAWEFCGLHSVLHDVHRSELLRVCARASSPCAAFTGTGYTVVYTRSQLPLPSLSQRIRITMEWEHAAPDSASPMY